MKRAELIARLRELQGDIYGAPASADAAGNRYADRMGHDVSPMPYSLGYLEHSCEHIARHVDALIDEIQHDSRGRR